MAIEAGDELRDFPHGCDVSGDVQGIGDQQQHYPWSTIGGNAVLMLAASPFP